MNNVTTITAQETLALVKELFGKYDKFALIKDNDRIVLEPLDEDDAKPYYELSREGEVGLKESIAQAKSGEVFPIESLFQD